MGLQARAAGYGSLPAGLQFQTKKGLRKWLTRREAAEGREVRGDRATSALQLLERGERNLER